MFSIDDVIIERTLTKSKCGLKGLKIIKPDDTFSVEIEPLTDKYVRGCDFTPWEAFKRYYNLDDEQLGLKCSGMTKDKFKDQLGLLEKYDCFGVRYYNFKNINYAMSTLDSVGGSLVARVSDSKRWIVEYDSESVLVFGHKPTEAEIFKVKTELLVN